MKKDLIKWKERVVAPYIGAWIEIQTANGQGMALPVAPYIGAWIEMKNYSHCFQQHCVAPYIGAWIEINTFDFLA
ncbi:hypothetical protein COA26_04660 [Bacillus cereus]|nr:hypothetical protein COA26_04660 [Bacillus cereus]